MIRFEQLFNGHHISVFLSLIRVIGYSKEMFLENEILLAVKFIQVLNVVSLAFYLDAVWHHLFAIQFFHHFKSLLFLLFANLLEILFLYLWQVHFLELFYTLLCWWGNSEIRTCQRVVMHWYGLSLVLGKVVLCGFFNKRLILTGWFYVLSAITAFRMDFWNNFAGRHTFLLFVFLLLLLQF